MFFYKNAIYHSAVIAALLLEKKIAAIFDSPLF